MSLCSEMASGLGEKWEGFPLSVLTSSSGMNLPPPCVGVRGQGSGVRGKSADVLEG